jgi:hypothetical protein
LQIHLFAEESAAALSTLIFVLQWQFGWWPSAVAAMDVVLMEDVAPVLQIDLDDDTIIRRRGGP